MANTYQAPTSEQSTAAVVGAGGCIAFNATGTVGLAVLDGAKLYRATVAGAWSLVADVVDLFGAPSNQYATSIAWGAGDTVAMTGLVDPGTSATWVLYSTDGGLTWTECASDFSAFDGVGSYPQVASDGSAVFVLIQNDPSSTYAFLAAVSSDSGATFPTINNGPAYVADNNTVRAHYDATAARFFALLNGVSSTSDDGGSTWSSLITAPGTGVTAIVDIVRTSASQLIAVGAVDFAGTPAVMTWGSADDGDTWSALSPTGVSPLAVLEGVALAGDEIVTAGYRATSGAVFYSSTNGVAFSSRADTVPIAPGIVVQLAAGFGGVYGVTTDGTTARIVSMFYTASADIVDVFDRAPVRYRMVIEGADAEWVNDITLASSDVGDGRMAYAGLIMDGAVIKEHAEIREGTTKIDPLRLKCVGPAADREFGKAPVKLAYLAASVETVDATEIEVTNASLITAGDYIHVGTECMQVSAIDVGTLTVSRQLRGTRPQLHLRAATGSSAGWEVPVFDKPATLQGRRVALTAYPADTTDEEAIVWIGKLSAHPYLADDGVTWCLDIDHISTLMDQTIGEIVSGDAGMLYATYHRACQFSFLVEYTRSGVTIGGELGGGVFAIEGVFASDEELFTELQDQIAGLGFLGLTWDIYRNGEGLIVFRVDTDTSFANDGSDAFTVIRIGSPLDGVCSHATASESSTTTVDSLPDSSTRYIVLRNTRRTHGVLAGFVHSSYANSQIDRIIDTTPRGVVGDPKVGVVSTDLYESPDNTTSEWIFHIDRDIGALSNETIITMHDAIWPVDGSRVTYDFQVTNVTDSGQTITVRAVHAFVIPEGETTFLHSTCFYYDDQTRVTARVAYGSGSWRDLIQVVVDESPLANTGATPFVTAGDLETLDFFTDEITRRVSPPDDTSILKRFYQPAAETALIDVLRPELLLTGCLLRMSSRGLISVAPLIKPSALSQTSITIDGDIIVTPHGDEGKWPGLLSSPDGIVCSVKIKDGDNEYLVVDKAALSHYKNRGAGMLEIEFKSAKYVADSRFLGSPTRISELESIGKSILSFFSESYSVITVPVNYRAIGVLVGDYVRLVTPHLIDPQTGDRGLDAVCLCIGRAWPLDATGDCYGELTLLAFTARVGGYAPSAVVAVLDGDPSSPPASVTLLVTQNFYAPTGENDLDHFAVGDGVRISGFNTTSAVGFRGTITSIPDATTCVVNVTSYDGAFGGTLVMEFDDAATSLTANQAQYVYVADAAGDVNGSPGFDFE